MKLNTYGSINFVGEKAKIGGMVWNSDGEWICGFVSNLGSSTIFQVEARVMLEGLSLAWRIEVESNNALRIHVIRSNYASDNGLTKIQLIHQFCRKK